MRGATQQKQRSLKLRRKLLPLKRKSKAKQAPVIEQCGQAAGDERERGLTSYGA